MKIVKSEKLTVLSITNAAPDTEPVWSAGKEYSIGEITRYEAHIYRCAFKNTGKNPLTEELSEQGTPYWVKIRPTNATACIDDSSATQTVAVEGSKRLEIVLPYSRCDAFALLNVEAVTADVTIRSKDGEVYYTEHISFIKDIYAFSTYEYFALPIEHVRESVTTQTPLLIGGTLSIVLHGYTPKIGHILAGRTFVVGATEYDANFDARTYSKINFNEFGVHTAVKRGYSKAMSLSVLVDEERCDTVRNFLADIIAVPVLVIGDNRDSKEGGYNALTVYGFVSSKGKIPPYAITEFTLEIVGIV